VDCDSTDNTNEDKGPHCDKNSAEQESSDEHTTNYRSENGGCTGESHETYDSELTIECVSNSATDEPCHGLGDVDCETDEEDPSPNFASPTLLPSPADENVDSIAKIVMRYPVATGYVCHDGDCREVQPHCTFDLASWACKI